MKFGVSTYIWSSACDQSVFDVLPVLRDRGFDGFEFPVFRAKGFPAAKIRRASADHQLECTAASGFVDGLSLISNQRDVRRTSVAHLKDLIKCTADAGAPILAGPMYSPVGYHTGKRRTSDEWHWALEGYQAVGETLHSHGVTLAIEPLNRFETYFLNTTADAIQLCEDVGDPLVGILLDTFHANIEEKDIGAAYTLAGKHLKHVHISENDRGTPGSGHIQWNEVFHSLAQLEYDGWLTIESFGFALGDLSAAASIWRDIETVPQAVAFEGIQFLRDNMPMLAAARTKLSA